MLKPISTKYKVLQGSKTEILYSSSIRIYYAIRQRDGQKNESKARLSFQKLLKRLKPLESLLKNTSEQNKAKQNEYNTHTAHVKSYNKIKHTYLFALAYNFHPSLFCSFHPVHKFIVAEPVIKID